MELLWTGVRLNSLSASPQVTCASVSGHFEWYFKTHGIFCILILKNSSKERKDWFFLPPPMTRSRLCRSLFLKNKVSSLLHLMPCIYHPTHPRSVKKKLWHIYTAMALNEFNSSICTVSFKLNEKNTRNDSLEIYFTVETALHRHKNWAIKGSQTSYSS